jgi:lipoprotein-anchoring transpeptidase ErfK/SrfK
VLVALLAVLLTGTAIAMYVYDQSRTEVIARGVMVGGLDVGGLTAPAARSRLRAKLRVARARLITIRAGQTQWTLTGGGAGLRADVDAAVDEAVRASRGGWFVSRTLRALFDGDHVSARIAMPEAYNPNVVDDLIARVRRQVYRPPRDARLSVDPRRLLVKVPSRRGEAARTGVLHAELDRALRTPEALHVLTVPMRPLHPRITTAQLAARYPAYIIIDRPKFKLFLYQRLRLTHTYRIAIGQAGLQTPAGLHHILDKQVNPSWHVPNSSWAGSLAGQVIPPGPRDPLVARWMAIDSQGDGIHGTNEPWSIGSAASHGCIRMLPSDVIQLYRMTPLGTPAYVL